MLPPGGRPVKKLHVVTGANRGIGYEIARHLTHRGDRVVATARKPGEADELNELSARVEPLDVSSAESVAAFAKALDGEPIDVLWNNAGQGVGRGTIEDVDWQDVIDLFAVNSVGPMRVTQALLPNLRAARTRVIANMSSKMGSIADNGSGDAYAYRASKCALNIMTKSLSVDLAGDGFTCVALHPGWVQTSMGGSSAPVTPDASARGLIEVIDGLDAERDNGRFLDFQGEEIPW